MASVEVPSVVVTLTVMGLGSSVKPFTCIVAVSFRAAQLVLKGFEV